MTSEDMLDEENAPDFIEAVAKDVPEKAADESTASPVDEYGKDEDIKIPAGMEELARYLTVEVELLEKRGRTLAALAHRGVFPNRITFDIVDEAIIAAYIRRVADFFEIPPEAIISSLEISNAKEMERQLQERVTSEEAAADNEDEYAFASYR